MGKKTEVNAIHMNRVKNHVLKDNHYCCCLTATKGKDYFEKVLKDKKKLEKPLTDLQVTQMNNKNRKLLIADLKKYKYGYFPIYGSYREAEAPADSTDREKSFFVIDTSSDNKKTPFIKRMMKLGEKYHQDSVLIIEPDGNAYLLYTRNFTDWNGAKRRIGERQNLGRGWEQDIKSPSGAFSELMNKRAFRIGKTDTSVEASVKSDNNIMIPIVNIKVKDLEDILI